METEIKSLGDLVDGIGQVLNVVRRDTSHANASILRQVDVVFQRQLLNLRWRQSSVAKHANLVGDVLPLTLAARLLQI